MAQKTMYTTIVGEPETTLTAPYQAGIDTTVHLADTSFLPDPGTTGNTCTIWLADRTYLVTVKYTGKLSNSITGVSVVQGYPQEALIATFPIGSILGKPLAQDDVQSIQDNIRDLDSAKVDKYQGILHKGKYLKVGEDGYITLASGGGGGGTTDYEDLDNKPQINSVELIGNKTSEELGIVVNLTKAQYDALSEEEKLSGKIFCTTDETGGESVADYTYLLNKPQVNSVTLTGNKTSSDLGLQSELVSGTSIKTINSQSVLGSGNIQIDGVTDYEELDNLPQINSVELTGNKSLSDLGIASESDLTTHTSDSTIHVTASDKTTWNAKADASDIPTALSELTADATHRLVTDAEKTAWTGKQDAITSTAKLSADLVDDEDTTNKFYHTHASTHALNGGDAVSIDASQVTSGIFSADRIPALAYQRMVTVADETAKSQLTSDDVSVGDTVYVQDGSKLYIVSSITGKGTASEVINYVIYTAYVSWNSITGKPSSYTPSVHASSHVNGTDDIQTANTSQKGLLSASDWNTFNAKQKSITVSTSEPTSSEGSDGDIWMVYTA